MTEANVGEEFMASINRQTEKGREYRLRCDVSEREMEGIIKNHILPHMPHTLFSCYTVSEIDAGYGHPLDQFTMILKPKVDMKNPEQSRIALGSVDKVAQALRSHGWEILEEPHAVANEYSKDMTINVMAGWALPRTLLDRMTRRNETPRYVRALLHFKGAHETDRCRLVEEEVTIPEEHRPERKEKRMKVVCDDD